MAGQGPNRKTEAFMTHPIKEEPGWGVSSVNYDLKALLDKAVSLDLKP